MLEVRVRALCRMPPSRHESGKSGDDSGRRSSATTAKAPPRTPSSGTSRSLATGFVLGTRRHRKLRADRLQHSERDDGSRQARVLRDRRLMKIMGVGRRDASAFLFMHQRRSRRPFGRDRLGRESARRAERGFRGAGSHRSERHHRWASLDGSDVEDLITGNRVWR